MGMIPIDLYHRGTFVQSPNGKLSYENGVLTEWAFNEDYWSFWGCLAELKNLGYPIVKKMWYKERNASFDGLRELTEDTGAAFMQWLAMSKGVVELYLEHPISKPEIINVPLLGNGEEEVNGEPEIAIIGERNAPINEVMIEEASTMDDAEMDAILAEVMSEIEAEKGQKGAGDDVPLEVEDEVSLEVGDEVPLGARNEGPVAVENEGIVVGENEGTVIGENEVPLSATNEVPLSARNEVPLGSGNEGIAVGENGGTVIGENEVLLSATNEVPLSARNEVPLGSGNEGIAVGENEGSKGVMGNQEEVNVEDWVSDTGSEAVVECGEVLSGSKRKRLGQGYKKGKEKKKAKGSTSNSSSRETETDSDSDDDGFGGFSGFDVDEPTMRGSLSLNDTFDYEGDYQSEELHSTSLDDDGILRRRSCNPGFQMSGKMTDYKWELGTCFSSSIQFKEAIKNYAIHSGRDVRIQKNDRKRVRVVCKAGCDWMVYCGKLPHEETWQIRKLFDEHTCGRDFKVKMLSSKWLSEKLVDGVRENPNMKVMDVRDRTVRKWNLGITKSKAQRARRQALDKVDGSYSEQFLRLHDYCAELIRSNPGSTVQLMVDTFPGANAGDPITNVFRRLYVCYAACKQSFRRCRPIIGLDGCFLKGPYGGQLLVAIGRDPNEQILPIAMAVVEGETKDSWSWFLELLISDIGGPNAAKACTFMSDQQKGLLPAIEELIPGVDQRFCVRHLHSNFRKKFPGKQLRDLMWTAAKASYPQEWERVMRQMRGVNEEAFKHLLAIPPRHWSRSRFSFNPKCDVLVNNMSETFNSVILDARSKPIVTMLNDIRGWMMERWKDHRKRSTEIGANNIMPRIAKRLKSIKDETRWWRVRMANENVFEVRHVNTQGEKYVVNLEEKTCSCRVWMLTGLPCTHAVSAMNSQNLKPEDYVPVYYRNTVYAMVYAPVIYPANGNNAWVRTEFNDVLPPPIRKQPGRPKKNRRKDQHEVNDQKRKGTMSRKGLSS